MNRKTFDKEMKIAEIEGEITEKRGVNWMVISLASVILIIIIGILATLLI